MAAILEDGKLRLSGYVGDYFFEDGFTSGDVVLALASIDDDEDLAVHINSGGGVASEGAAIHALLTARAGTTNVVVEGIAASAASLIAMAGDTVTMSAGAVMMIHDPSGYTFGTSADHSKTVEGLEALATAYSRVYAAKSGKTAEACREIMKAERWLTPEQAVEEGFADDTTEVKAGPVAAFDYRMYAHAPNRLTALASKKNWSFQTKMAASAAQRPPQEHSMTDKERADQLAAELEKLKATAKADADKLASLEEEKADRARQDAIMALPEAVGREAMAKALAASPGMTADAAKAVLSAAAPASDDDAGGEPEFQPRRMNAAGLNKTAANGKPEDKAAARAVLAASVDRFNKRR